MNKNITTVIVVIVIALGGYFLLRSPQIPPQETIQTPQAPTVQAPITQETTSVSQNVVTHTDSGYSPSTLRVKVGENVTFKNSSSNSMWTAADFHPTHRAYPTTGGCLGSTFDACKGVQPNDSWSFKFDITGTWKYHDHLTPDHTGMIVVEN